MELNEMGCNLIINTNDDNPELINEIITVAFSEISRKGENKITLYGNVIPNSVNIINLWMLKPPPLIGNENIYLNTAIQNTLSIIESNQDAFLKLFKKYNSYLLCYAYYKEVNPFFTLNQVLIKKIQELNLSVDFDIYCLPPEEKNEIVTFD